MPYADPEKKRAQDREYRFRNAWRLRDSAQAWRERNPDRVLQYRRDYVERHPERKRESSREWARRNAAQLRAYYEANKGEIEAYKKRWRDENQEKVRSWQKRWKSQNTALVNAATRRRRARLRGLDGDHSASDIAAIMESQEFRCFYCGTSLGDYHVDHMTPVSRGGSNGPENLCCACSKCNQRKGTKTAEEFLSA